MKIEALFADSRAVEHGFVDEACMLAAVDTVCNKGDQKWILALMKTIGFELWLRTRTPPLALHPFDVSTGNSKSSGASQRKFRTGQVAG